MKKVEHEWKFVIDVPVTQIDSFEFYIKTQWLHENRIQPDFVISEILDIKQESKLEQVNINYYRTCL